MPSAGAVDDDYARRGVASLEELLLACAAFGVTFMVCEMGLKVIGLEAAALRADLNIAEGGVVSFLADASPKAQCCSFKQLRSGVPVPQRRPPMNPIPSPHSSLLKARLCSLIGSATYRVSGRDAAGQKTKKHPFVFATTGCRWHRLGAGLLTGAEA